MGIEKRPRHEKPQREQRSKKKLYEKAIEALSKALEIIPDLDFAQKVLKLAKKAKNEELKKQ